MASQRIELPPYDPAGNCPKCGGEDVNTTHHDSIIIFIGSEKTNIYGCSKYSGNPDAFGAHMDRRCRNCDWAWVEQPYQGGQA